MNPNMWGRGNMQQGGQDPASRWLAQQGQMRPAQSGQTGQQIAQAAANARYAANGGRAPASPAQAMAPHPALQQAAMAQQMPHIGGGMQAYAALRPNGGSQYAALQPGGAGQFAALQPGGQYAALQPQGAIHPAMQHALDQQAHLQSQLGAMRVQPQPQWNAGPTMGGQMMGQSPWGRR